MLNNSIRYAISAYEQDEVQSLSDSMVNVKDTEGRTDLHHAAFNEDVDIVKSLLARGADVNARDNNETTPLHSARSKAVAEILVNNGADIHAINKNGNTPFLSALHFANESVVSYNNDKSFVCKELLEFLIKCGSNVPKKFTSLLESIGIDAIAKEEISPITKFVMENKDNFNSNTIEKIKDLLAKGYDINARDSNGYTPLYYAWSDKNNSNNMLLKFLVEQGADPKIQKYYNSPAGTLLAYAARAGDKEFVELLLKKGANIINSSAKNGLGLMVGAYLKFVSKQSIFESLKKYNSHIDDAIKIEVIKTYLGEEYVDCYNNTNTFNTDDESVKDDTNISVWERITECIKDKGKQVMVDILLSGDYNSLLCDKLGVDVNIDDNEHAELLARCLDYEI